MHNRELLANVICMISWGRAFARIVNMQAIIVYLIICNYVSCKVVTLREKESAVAGLMLEINFHPHCSIVASPASIPLLLQRLH